MNIVFINNCYLHPNRVGGIARTSWRIADYLMRNGHTVCSVFLQKMDVQAIDGIKGYQVPSCRDDKSALSDWFCKFLEKNNVDAIINHGHMWLSPIICEAISKTLCTNSKSNRCKLITVHHANEQLHTLSMSDLKREQGLLKGGLKCLIYPIWHRFSLNKLLKLHRMSYKSSDKTVVLSKSGIGVYSACIGLNDCSKLDYVNNASSFTDVEPNLKQKRQAVITVARLSSEKRIDLLLRSWKLVDGDCDWKLYVIGDGPCRGQWEQLARELSLHNVKFLGTQISRPYFEGAAIYAHTSETEGFPLTVVEALQNGAVPVVMNSFPAAKDLIVDGKNGLLVQFGNCEMMAEKMRTLISDESKRNNMAANAIESSKQYEMKVIGRKWLSILN